MKCVCAFMVIYLLGNNHVYNVKVDALPLSIASTMPQDYTDVEDRRDPHYAKSMNGRIGYAHSYALMVYAELKRESVPTRR